MFCYVAYYNSIDISISPRNGHYHARNNKNHADIKLKHFCYPTLNKNGFIYVLEFH